MRKKILSAILSVAMLGSMLGAFAIPASAAKNAYTRQVEYLTRGLVAVKVNGGIYMSWRLLGTEPLTQTFDIYRDGKKIETAYDGTNYTDKGGFSYNKYQVVPTGTAAEKVDESCDKTEVWSNNYIDIPLDKPEGGTTTAGESYTYSVNDTSVADVDGDGEYEYIIKWDPSNSKDNSFHGQTGNVLLDCYELDGTKLWRIDLGINIRAGAHYTQFIAYDFDGDGKAEVAMRTAPGSKDSTGGYVSRVGAAPLLGPGVAADPFTWKDASTNVTYKDTDDLRQTGSKSGHIIKGPDWLTMFNGQTGEAMQTVNYPVQRGSVKSWGDSYGGRSERNVAGVAYLNGETPSLIMCRGYYTRATMGAYDWDGTNFTKLWVRDDKDSSKAKTTLYSNGNHQLSVADMDNDGKDEVTIGSAAADDDGGMLHSTGHGHGDALHVSDFNNDGWQEVFTVHEEKTYYKTWGAELRKGSANGSSYFGDNIGNNILSYTNANGDNGRGVMANIDDDYAYAHGFHSYYWSVADGYLYQDNGSGTGTAVSITSTVDGQSVTTKVSQPSSCNSLVYWDGDLSRELLDRNRIDKYSVENGQIRLATFDGVHSNNGSKANAAISGDLFGDWREEVAFGTADDTALRIFTTTIPTDYKLTTLMHDTQYRCAIAWQNVGYNQPPHPSYYIGKDSLASGKNYLAPTTPFDKVKMTAAPTKTAVTPDEDITLLSSSSSFDDGNWGIGTKTTTSAPYNNIAKVNSGTVTKDLDLELTSDEILYNTLRSFEMGDRAASVDIKNDTSRTYNAKLYIAAYTENGALSELKEKDITVEGGTSDVITSDEVTVPVGGTTKAFLWDKEGKEPVTEPLTSVKRSITNKTLDSMNATVETVEFAFDWKPESSDNTISILSAEGENMVALSKKTSSAMQYTSGKNAAKTVNSTLTKNAWYHVNVTMDLTSKTADISVLDYETSGATEKIVYAAPFNGVDGLPQKLSIKNASSLDNVDISKVEYNVERNLINFTVKDNTDNPVADAKIAINGTTLTTDSEGNAAIKVKNKGIDYSYTVSKPAYKVFRGTVPLIGDIGVTPVINPGETRKVFVKYMYDGVVDISDAVEDSDQAVATAIENTTYTLADSLKKDIVGYRFPTDEDDIVPGYEDFAGQTYNLEFDPDKSDVVNAAVGEGGDTTISLAYRIKYAPTEADTEIARIQYGEGGIGSNPSGKTGTGNNGEKWTLSSNAAFEPITDNGKFMRVTNLGTSTLTVEFKNTSDKVVMEFDMRYEDMPWGGNYFGVTPYSGTTAGQGFGMRTSGEANEQWQLCYRSGGDQYLTSTTAALGKDANKPYSYAYNWRDQWMHMVLVSDGSGNIYITQANKETGFVYVQDQPVPMTNSVGTSSKPINKLVFGRTYKATDGDAVIGFKNFKAYKPGEISVDSGIETDTRTINVPSSESFEYEVSGANHPADMPGVTYDASALMNVAVTYKLLNDSDEEVTPAGYTLGSDGTLTVAEDADTSQHYTVGVYLNGILKKKTRLSYILKTEIFKSVFSGDTQGFTVTPSNDSTVVTSAANGQLTVKATNSQNDVTISKTFEGADSGKVEIQFDVKNGGTQITSGTWNWTGNEFEMGIGLLDSSQNSILNISEEFTSKAQDIYYKIGSASKAKIKGNWTETTVKSGLQLAGSARVWTVKATLDLDTRKADFMIYVHASGTDSSPTYQYDMKNVDISGISDFAQLKLTGTRKGAGLYWEPYIENLTVYKYAPAE